jgi:integrase
MPTKTGGLRPRTKSFAKVVRDLPPAPQGKRTHEPVPGEPGLYVRVTDKGAKTFTVVARRPDKKQKWAAVPIAVDMYNLTPKDLDRVRLLAREGITNIKQGDEAFPPPPPEPDSVRTVGDKWLERHVRKNGHLSADKTARRLERLVYPVIGRTRLDEIKRKDVAELLDRIEDENGSTQAQRVYEDLRSMFAWQEGRDNEFVSPIVKALRRKKTGSGQRRRVLSDQEIRLLWPICEGTFGGLVRVLLLSGQRLEKVQQMRWQDIDKAGVWTIPEKDPREKANAKILPLPPAAIDIIEFMPRIVGNDYVFASGRTDGPINGLGKAKKALDEKLLAALKEESAELPAWQLHSLRHTAKTLMSRCRVSDFDSERVLGHRVAGISGHYNHHDFKESNGAALRRLAAEVQRIVDVTPDSVVPRGVAP